jgi:hypothetical protein
MERVTIEQNGERFTLEVPEGTSDADIQSFISQQQGTQPNITQMLTPPAEPSENIAAGVAGMARPLAQAYYEGPAKGGVRDVANMANILKQATPEVAAELAKNPIDVAKAYIQGHPWYGEMKSIPGRAAGFAGRTVAGALTAPESAALLPYNMAAYEQARIRANPTAPEYASNPYAMTVRNEAPTQAAAGAINQRLALMGQRYGGITPEQQQILQQDRQRQAAQMTLKQPATTQNYMQRMRALSELYSPVTP